MNEIVKMMQHLNNAEKRAVKAHRILTHAFFTSKCYACLEYRYNRINEFEPATMLKLTHIASAVEAANWRRWCTEAEKAGLR